eukprot:1188454-Alexandrium_andersonii.AAC.1
MSQSRRVSTVVFLCPSAHDGPASILVLLPLVAIRFAAPHAWIQQIIVNSPINVSGRFRRRH